LEELPLAEAVRERGITIGGGVPMWRGTSTYPLFSVMSPPLSDVLKAFEKPSQNQIGEILLRSLGRARGGVGLMVTGGFAPNIEGWAKPFAGTLATSGAARRHRIVTDAVHAEGGRIALQILHTGRYGYHPLCVAPSRIQSPISPFTPRSYAALIPASSSSMSCWKMARSCSSSF
jgi:hypothetical protein